MIRHIIIKSEDAIERFERAVRADEMRGAEPPETWEAIEEELEKAREDLLAICKGITLQKPIKAKVTRA